jgi:hypothetical protein
MSTDRSSVAGSALRCTAFALALSLAGCATPNPVRALPDGTYQVDCPGSYHDWSTCYVSAEKQCGARAYRIVQEISDEGGAVGRGDWSREGSEVSRTLEFRCVE